MFCLILLFLLEFVNRCSVVEDISFIRKFGVNIKIVFGFIRMILFYNVVFFVVYFVVMVFVNSCK